MGDENRKALLPIRPRYSPGAVKVQKSKGPGFGGRSMAAPSRCIRSISSTSARKYERGNAACPHAQTRRGSTARPIV